MFGSKKTMEAVAADLALGRVRDQNLVHVRDLVAAARVEVHQLTHLRAVIEIDHAADLTHVQSRGLNHDLVRDQGRDHCQNKPTEAGIFWLANLLNALFISDELLVTNSNVLSNS